MNFKKIFFTLLIFLITTSNAFAFNLELVGINGQKTNVDNFKGKIVVMTFFDVGCYYCQKEVPTLNKLYELYGKNQKNVVVIGVDPFDHVDQIRAFASQFGVKYPLYWGNYSQTTPLGGIFATPTSIFIDKKGIPRVRVPGKISESDFIEIIKSLQ
ncbi:MAG: TlpA family protein disulfide reductase [Desulfurella sp.]|uniref:Peroxiredoxin n=1 Tax=Desulfurella multipotens TaxID=79269 RepID=A0A1G6K796_9BACT|nr:MULTISPECIES: TlpA disulfide reductase family protein [Desulfurella]PMP87899.1 MAG: TlpA family protein disulfide reductase [Desulfurella sp.]SDC26711.1 Peroxiredoxin [Desulfurella multipotens]